MDNKTARDIFRRDTRRDTLARLGKRDDFDDQMETAYEMAADALEYQFIPVEGVTFGGNQVYYRV